MRVLPLFLFAVLLPLHGSGASEVVLLDEWRAPDTGGTPFKRLLAAGITSDAAARRKFEDRFVSLLRGREVTCSTSYSVVPDLAKVHDPAKVADALLAQQVDGVITVHLVPLEGTTEEAEWVVSWERALGEPGRVRAYVEASLGRPPVETDHYGVEVTLWSVATGDRVWAIRSGRSKIGKFRKVAGSLVEDVISALRQAQLL